LIINIHKLNKNDTVQTIRNTINTSIDIYSNVLSQNHTRPYSTLYRQAAELSLYQKARHGWTLL